MIRVQVQIQMSSKDCIAVFHLMQLLATGIAVNNFTNSFADSPTYSTQTSELPLPRDALDRKKLLLSTVIILVICLDCKQCRHLADS